MSGERMPWGKYRGRRVEDTPSSYLVWVLEECDNVYPDLRQAIEDALADRFAKPCSFCEGKSSGALSAGLINSWYRKLSLSHHPDRGGSTERMQAINAAHELLKEMVNGGS